MATIDLTIGAIVVSTFFSFLTMGVCLVVGYDYFQLFPRDRPVFKLLVSLALLMCLVDTVADGYWCYEWTTTFYADPTIMGILPVALIVEIFCVGAIAVLVQGFYAWRLWKISEKKNWWLPGIICACSLCQFVVVLWVVGFWSQNRLMTDVGRVLPVGYLWLVPCIVADLLVTGGMVFYLKYNNKTSFSSSKTSFSQIISRTIQANTLSLLSQIVTISLFKANVGLYFFLNDFTIVKVYTFSLLISLNARKSPHSLFNNSSQTNSHSQSVQLASLSHGRAPRGGIIRGDPSQGNVVSVQVRHDVTVDDSSDSWPENKNVSGWQPEGTPAAPWPSKQRGEV